MTERDALTAIKNLAVVPVAICVRRASLLAMTQDSGESAREYYARIKGRADTCSYKSKCTCSLEVDFTEIIIKDVFVSGISDNEIRENVLGWTELDCSDMAATIKYVEGKETARNAVSMDRGSVNASGFQRRKSESRPVRSDKDEDRDVEQKLKLTAKCPECRSEFHQYKRMGKSVNKRPFKLCKPCFDKEKAADNITSFSIIGGVRASLVNKGRGSNRRLGDNLVLPRDIQIPLEHQTFDGLQWRKAVREDHPKINVRLEICANDYTSHGMSPPASSVHIMESVTDTGAQVPLFPRKSLSKIGLTRHDFFRVQHKIYAANRSPIDIDGAFFAKVGGNSPTGNSTRAMIFVSPDATGFFLSKKLLKELDILPHNFPTFTSPQNDVVAGVKKGESVSHKGGLGPQLTPLVNTGGLGPQLTPIVNAEEKKEDRSSTSDDKHNGERCSHPQRTLPPGRPTELPFACRPENNSKMKNWLLQRYASSTFNTCPDQTLPNMEGPPIRIHVDKDATPYRARVPAEVPLHWQEEVEADLLCDMKLGVIERVPKGEVPKFTFRMVLTRKSSGRPRRTVDMSPLNRQSKREIHSMKSPFQLARSIPPNTWKSVLDAWNGFHSLLIHPDDRHLTTFITPIGLFRYVRAPQGFLSSGDGYNRRMDEILLEFERLVRCVDDISPHDDHLETHWWRIIDLLETLGEAGVVLNPDKFQFASRTVDFAGFRVSDSDVEPLPKFLDSIANFPTPENITDIRSWFGLINQASHYAQLRDLMEPFRPFLKPSTPFVWNDELEQTFQKSKRAILELIRDGVKIFDQNKPTCLRFDYSELGLGFYLCQKHCDCPDPEG